jgi:signal peptide peptidase SppA
MPIKDQDALWAGSESSLQVALAADEAITARLASGVIQDTTSELPTLLKIQGGVGVISIKGPITNRDSWLNSMFGVTSYGMIREALVAAANSEEVKQILLDVESGGGAVNGVSDTAALVTTINDKIKPVTSFTDGGMLSAAYWLGASAGNVFSSSTAMVGSIGVIATHAEQSEALKKEGIKVTVMRAGKYKALANSNEPLTSAAKEQIQSSLDAVYEVFVQHIADARGQTYQFADTKMAQGREFTGASAVEAGLSDGITSFDAIMSLLSKKALDTPPNFINNQKSSTKGQTMSTKKALTEQEIAALSAGAPDVSAEALAAAAALAAETDASAALVAQAEADAAAALAAETDTSASTDADDKIVAFLQTELKAANEAILSMKVDAKIAADKLVETQAVFEPMLAIVRKSVANMQVALGGSALDLESQSATQVLAEHKRVGDTFASKFKAGGIAALDAAAEKKVVAVDPNHRARIAATQPAAKTAK